MNIAQAIEAQNRIDNATLDSIIPEVEVTPTKNGVEVKSTNDLFTQTVNVVISSKEEIKSSGGGSGAEDQEKASNRSLTEILTDQTVSDGDKLQEAVDAIRSIREMYSTIEPEMDTTVDTDFLTVEDKLEIVSNSVKAISKKLHALKDINVGNDIFNLEIEKVKLVATDYKLLSVAYANKEKLV